MKLYVTRIPPCEEVAAEPGTARLLTESMSGALAERFPEYLGTNDAEHLGSLPVVLDPALKPGVVQLRPRSRT